MAVGSFKPSMGQNKGYAKCKEGFTYIFPFKWTEKCGVTSRAYAEDYNNKCKETKVITKEDNLGRPISAYWRYTGAWEATDNRHEMYVGKEIGIRKYINRQ